VDAEKEEEEREIKDRADRKGSRAWVHRRWGSYVTIVLKTPVFTRREDERRGEGTKVRTRSCVKTQSNSGKKAPKTLLSDFRNRLAC